MINQSIKRLENKFNNKIVTLVWKFDKFYIAEDYHQDYYQNNFIRYLMYKKACQREEVLNKNMELKKYIIFLIFIFFTGQLNAELIKPNKNRSLRCIENTIRSS